MFEPCGRQSWSCRIIDSKMTSGSPANLWCLCWMICKTRRRSRNSPRERRLSPKRMVSHRRTSAPLSTSAGSRPTTRLSSWPGVAGYLSPLTVSFLVISCRIVSMKKDIVAVIRPKAWKWFQWCQSDYPSETGSAACSRHRCGRKQYSIILRSILRHQHEMNDMKKHQMESFYHRIKTVSLTVPLAFVGCCLGLKENSLKARRSSCTLKSVHGKTFEFWSTAKHWIPAGTNQNKLYTTQQFFPTLICHLFQTYVSQCFSMAWYQWTKQNI